MASVNLKEIMLAGLSNEWLAILDTPELDDICAKLDPTDLCPAPELVFRFAKLTEISAIRVKLIGQDPYSDPEDACGLSFSVPIGRPIPPSLKNIAECIGITPSHGDLTHLARQGVLLINTALTTRAGRTKIHSKLWRPYVFALLRKLPESPILSFGIDAGKMTEGMSGVLSWGHPSPLNLDNTRKDSPKHFIHCPYFRQLDFIDWNWAKPINYIFTDGGATKNGKKDCRAAWAYKLYPGDIIDSGRVPPPASNNRGELLAIINGIKRAAQLNMIPATCYSDSEYSIKSITKWYPNWIKTGVKKLNMDLIGEAYELTKKYRICYVHVRSHTAEPIVSNGDIVDPQYANKLLIWTGNRDCDLACSAVLNQ